MLKKIIKSLLVLSLSCLMLTAPAMVNACDFNTVLSNCDQTALNNYRNGDISTALFYKFQNTYCPAAAVSCIDKR